MTRMRRPPKPRDRFQLLFWYDSPHCERPIPMEHQLPDEQSARTLGAWFLTESYAYNMILCRIVVDPDDERRVIESELIAVLDPVPCEACGFPLDIHPEHEPCPWAEEAA